MDVPVEEFVKDSSSSSFVDPDPDDVIMDDETVDDGKMDVPVLSSSSLMNDIQYQPEDMVTESVRDFHHPSIYSWGRRDLKCLFHHTDSDHKDGIYSYNHVNRNFIFIASNIYHSAALTSTGELYTTGDNSEGQVRDCYSVADDESMDHKFSKPKIVESLINQRISSVSCGSSHTVCVTASGCAISFGGNECGQLGHSVDKITHVAPRMSTFVIDRSVHGHGVVVKKVACGDLFTLFLSTTGEVYGCGSSIYLGNKTAVTAAGVKDGKTSDDVLQATNVCSAQRIETLVSLHIVDITAGCTHSMAITARGELYTWGANNQFQLGYDNPPQQTHQQLPRKVLFKEEYGTLQVIGIRAGYQHSIIWTDEGLLLGCGANKYGQIGLPSPRVESFEVIPLDFFCIMAACGYNHTLALCDSTRSRNTDHDGSSTAIGAVSTILYGFGANNNNQVSGSTTVSIVRTPMVLNDCLQVWNLTQIHYISAGGDQSFVIATNSDGTVLQQDNSSSPMQFPLRKQFSTLASKSVEPMSSASMCSLLLKARKECSDRITDSASSTHSNGSSAVSHHNAGSIEYTYASSAVLEIFSSPSLLGGSFLRDSSLSSSFSAVSSFEQCLDVQGLENCYVTLMQLGSDITARLLAATQQAITEIEHAVQRSPLSSSMQALAKVVMILWQNPLMVNPKLSLDLFTRLLKIARICEKELIDDVFQCYPQHILVARVLKPLQEHLSFHLRAGQSDPTALLMTTSKIDILTLLSTFLKNLHDCNAHFKEPLALDLFYNQDIDLFTDLVLAKDCLDWQKKQGKSTFTINYATTSGPIDLKAPRFYFHQYPFLLSIHVKLRVINAESQMHQQFAQRNAVNFGLFSGTNIFQPWFVLPIQREHLLQQSLIHIAGASANDLKKPLKVVFVGEEGVDEGGVKKELFQLLISQLFSDQYGMFHTAASGRVLWINHTNRWCNEEYKLVGTLLALAVYNGVLLDVQLPPVFYKKLLRQSVTLLDMKGIDPELCTGLFQLLHYEPAMEVEYVFCRSFVTEWDEYGASMTKELIEDGKSVAVTGSNRQLYVDKLVEWTLNESISEQFSSLLEGFHRIINPTMIEHFTPLELERLMTGLPHLDFKELESSTQYIGDPTWTAEHPLITAFWSIIHHLSFGDKQKFLLFVTGSNKAPIGGLKNLNLRIQRMGPHSNSLPTAHTCFNTLLLPEYTSSDILKDRLLKAIYECEGFGLK